MLRLLAFLACLFAVPAYSQVMVGALINTVNPGAVECDHEIPQIAAFDAALPQPPAILHCYTDFNSPFPEADVEAIEASGSTAMVDWKCDQLTSINSGADDATITAFAQAAAAHKSLLYLRFYYEMNQAWPGCGANTNPAAFVAAWIRIHNIFVAQGATNVLFVWCPAHTGNSLKWWPGDAYIDVYGVDGYDKAGTGATAVYMFSAFLKTWEPRTIKPIFICETAAQAYVDQVAYLQAVPRFLHNHPQIAAFIYFSSPASPQYPDNWELEDGLPAYAALIAAQPQARVR